MLQQVTISKGLNGLQLSSAGRETNALSLLRNQEDWVAPKAHRADAPTGRITSCTLDTEVVEETCTFLGKRQPILCQALWHELHISKPLADNPLLSTRQVRDEIPPLPFIRTSPQAGDTHSTPSNERRATSYELSFSKIDQSHWAYAKHRHVGNYEHPRSEAEAKKAAKREGKSDIKELNKYLGAYEELSHDVSGKNLWKATRHAAADRGPYYTTMEIVKQEANPPQHFYALIHYGMDLHMLYEQSLHRKPEDAPSSAAKLTGILQECFKAIARMYREDFCQAG